MGYFAKQILLLLISLTVLLSMCSGLRFKTRGEGVHSQWYRLGHRSDRSLQIRWWWSWVHDILYGGIYSFSFKPNIFGATHFYCSFSWQNAEKSFDIYKDERDYSRCEDCSWRVTEHYLCVSATDSLASPETCYDWNGKFYLWSVAPPIVILLYETNHKGFFDSLVLLLLMQWDYRSLAKFFVMHDACMWLKCLLFLCVTVFHELIIYYIVLVIRQWNEIAVLIV